MIFTAATKAELLAFIQTIDPSVDIAPYQERIRELEIEVERLSNKLIDVRAALATAVATAA